MKSSAVARKIVSKREAFTEDLAIRIQNVQIECTDALRIINSRDRHDSFFYIDPPYFNSHCGHYNGYTLEDFEMLLKLLSMLQGKFLLSSYPSDVLSRFCDMNGWHQRKIERLVTVDNLNGSKKRKTEVLTANFAI